MVSRYFSFCGWFSVSWKKRNGCWTFLVKPGPGCRGKNGGTLRAWFLPELRRTNQFLFFRTIWYFLTICGPCGPTEIGGFDCNIWAGSRRRGCKLHGRGICFHGGSGRCPRGFECVVLIVVRRPKIRSILRRLRVKPFPGRFLPSPLLPRNRTIRVPTSPGVSLFQIKNTVYSYESLQAKY